ncbi:hypothetical protein [Paenibacillus glacialis]|uniref:Uncharacterized protein n=1 Tax=Paenibacillus glacialis TaxID=494026 RepID=A0A168K9M6_9BACL|nr:hypothetical protein [Paenibacillus glacialis]OAB41741.1 hypothetical protein PGLA_15850 [Paenibacillus glacialis]
MRIQSGINNNRLSIQNARSNPLQLTFNFELEKQLKAKEEKKEDPSGKLVTSHEGGYIRQYIVSSDGSKILVSEIKQNTDEATLTENYTNHSTRPSSEGISHNTEQIMNLLNYNAGIIR